MATALEKFDQELRKLGIPIHGISGTGPDCRIDFKDEATPEQIEIANTAKANFPEDDPLPPEYQQKRAELQTEYPLQIQIEAVYKFAKAIKQYVETGMTPDINAKPGTPEHWVAWQDEIRAKVPKPQEK